jgi:hypothetical protein
MKLPEGTVIYMGPPAKPMDCKSSERIGTAVATIPGIFEAHLPQAYIEKVIDPSEQVLVVVLEDDIATVRPALLEALRRTFPEGSSLAVFEWHRNNPLLPAARNSGTELLLRRPVN